MLEKLSKCFYTQLDVFASESVERFTRNIEVRIHSTFSVLGFNPDPLLWQDLLSQEDKIGDFIKKAKRSIEYEIYLFDATCKGKFF